MNYNNEELYMLNRRKFLKILGKTALGMWLSNFIPAIAEATTGDIAYVRQIISKDISNSRTIMWQTNILHTEAVLLYRQKNFNDFKNITPQIKTFHDDGETIYIYTAQINNLQAGCKYEYKVFCNNGETPLYSLTTPQLNEPFTALIFPDSQCSDGYVTWRNVAQNAFQQNPNASFMINMGDLVDNGEAAWQWRQWQDGIDNIWKTIPFAPIMGNHETYNLNWLCRLPLAYLAYFATPDNNSSSFNRYYYSYDVGPVHFIVLNTMWDELRGLNDGIVEEQLHWLTNDVQQSDKPWQVVLMHKDVIFYDEPSVWRSPAYPKNKSDIGTPVKDFTSLPENTSLADIDEVGKIFMPYFDKLNIDVVLTAHQHTYRRHNHIYNFQPSEQGPVYFCTGVAGNSRYNVAFTHRFDTKYLDQPETNNYMTLTATTNNLKFACYLPNGKLVDEYTLKK